MFSKSISRRLALQFFVGSAIGFVTTSVSSADGGYSSRSYYRPRPKKYWPSNLVRSIQRRLKGLGFDPGPIDGIYGPKTKESIIEFQRSKNLEVDGKISKRLIRELDLG